MHIKRIITIIISVFVSLSSNADWVKTNKDMYGIMNIDNSKIIDTVVSTGADKNYPRVIFTTMYANKEYYRCAHDSGDMAELACYVLQKGKNKKDGIWF